MANELSGKVVMITGASRGIGAATALAFAREGAKVVLLARNVAQISGLAADIGPDALAICCDVSRFDQLSHAVRDTLAKFGRIDVFIGNAGIIGPIAPLETMEPAAFGEVIDINLKGVFNGMRAVIPEMLRQGGGTIITVSSGAAHSPIEGWSGYCASKAGAYMLTRNADHELRGRGLRVLGLSPGTVATDMQRVIKASGINPVSQLDWSDHIPPEWAAKALVWMCGAAADEFRGQDVSLRDPAIRAKVGVA